MEDYLYKNKYLIKSARLPFWNYSDKGFYFTTICTYNRIHYFGEIKNDKMYLNDIGYIAKIFLKQIPKHFKNIKIDSYVVMPNHIHIIIKIGKGNINNIYYNAQTRRDEALPRLKDIPILNKDGAVPRLYKNNILSKSNSLSSIIGSYKSIRAKIIRKKYNPDFKWQARFYDNVIKDELALYQIRYYIIHNPENWKYDRNNID